MCRRWIQVRCIAALIRFCSAFRCQMHVQVCGGVALDGALMECGGGLKLEEVSLSNLASSLTSFPGL